MKLIYWKNDVIRNDTIFRDMATILLWVFQACLYFDFYRTFVIE